jgi:hypothetical protein
MAEQRPFKPFVEGSIPSALTSCFTRRHTLVRRTDVVTAQRGIGNIPVFPLRNFSSQIIDLIV